MALLAGIVLLAVQRPASAHPFGEPQTVRVSAQDSQVTVVWSAPPDDLLLLGSAVGALPSRREIVFDVSPDGEVEPVGDTDADRLVSSQEVVSYLEEHVAVRQFGHECRQEVSLDDLLGEGARLVFSCPEPIEEVEIDVATMTDLHEAYRTAAVGDGTTSPTRTLYTSEMTSHTWRFGVADDDADELIPAVWLFISVSLALLVASVLALLYLRGRGT